MFNAIAIVNIKFCFVIDSYYICRGLMVSWGNKESREKMEQRLERLWK